MQEVQKVQKVTKWQISRMHALLAKKYPHILQDAEVKADFIFGYTGDAERVSTKLMTFAEADAAIKFLQYGAVAEQTGTSYRHYSRFDVSIRTHRYILSMCMTIGWTVYSDKLKREVADLNKLGQYIANHSPHQKPLKEHNGKELKQLVLSMERMVTTYKAKVAKAEQDG